jgi:hypothetical protein
MLLPAVRSAMFRWWVVVALPLLVLPGIFEQLYFLSLPFPTVLEIVVGDVSWQLEFTVLEQLLVGYFINEMADNCYAVQRLLIVLVG